MVSSRLFILGILLLVSFLPVSCSHSDSSSGMLVPRQGSVSDIYDSTGAIATGGRVSSWVVVSSGSNTDSGVTVVSATDFFHDARIRALSRVQRPYRYELTFSFDRSIVSVRPESASGDYMRVRIFLSNSGANIVDRDVTDSYLLTFSDDTSARYVHFIYPIDPARDNCFAGENTYTVVVTRDDTTTETLRARVRDADIPTAKDFTVFTLENPEHTRRVVGYIRDIALAGGATLTDCLPDAYVRCRAEVRDIVSDDLVATFASDSHNGAFDAPIAWADETTLVLESGDIHAITGYRQRLYDTTKGTSHPYISVHFASDQRLNRWNSMQTLRILWDNDEYIIEYTHPYIPPKSDKEDSGSNQGNMTMPDLPTSDITSGVDTGAFVGTGEEAPQGPKLTLHTTDRDGVMHERQTFALGLSEEEVTTNPEIRIVNSRHIARDGYIRIAVGKQVYDIHSPHSISVSTGSVNIPQ